MWTASIRISPSDFMRLPPFGYSSASITLFKAATSCLRGRTQQKAHGSIPSLPTRLTLVALWRVIKEGLLFHGSLLSNNEIAFCRTMRYHLVGEAHLTTPALKGKAPILRPPKPCRIFSFSFSICLSKLLSCSKSLKV
jgi:hypothetical protein